MQKLISKLNPFAGKPSTNRTPARPRVRPQLEVLDDRLAPAVTFAVYNGNLQILGDDNPQTIVVKEYAHSYDVISNGYTDYFTKDQLYGGEIYFYGYGGDDVFDISKTYNLKATAYGYEGRDWLVGGALGDYLSGNGGHDVLVGNDGSDTLSAGFDYVTNDLYGGGGVDYMYGSFGDDLMYGGKGADFMYGYEGNDELHGEDDHDYIYGGNGNDWLIGEGGIDDLYGENGDDVLNGGDDGLNDVLFGGQGRDWFQQDWKFYYSRFAMYGSSGGYWWNHDSGRDFNANEDFYYDAY